MITRHQFEQYVGALYETDKTFDESQPNRLSRHRHLDPDSAQFLASFILAKSAKNLLEIGTSTGYSTLWLAYALSQLENHNQAPAHLTSIELDAQRLLTAKNHLLTLQLNRFVSLQQADAKDFLSQCQTSYEVVFLDAERKFYLDYVIDLKRILPFGGVLIVDNVLSHAHEVAEFLAQFTDDENFICTTLPLGAGLFMAIKLTAD